VQLSVGFVLCYAVSLAAPMILSPIIPRHQGMHVETWVT